ncbi:MAG: HAD family hydrolase [Ignavibacteria bacterium]|nr:HAD family hydrolase [Ignavibacteria bacterium]
MKLIIFDIDGTLCHSRNVDDKCYIKAFKKTLGIDISNTDWNSYKHVTDLYVTKEIIKNETGSLPGNEIVEAIIDNYAEELKQQINAEETLFTAIPGIKELFDYFSTNQTNYVAGIATGGFLKTAMYKLNRIEIHLPSELIYSSNDFDTKQEMLREFIKIQSAINSGINKIVYVGDRVYDYNAAKDLDIDFVGIDFKNNGKLKSLGIEKVINDYKPMEKFLALI